MLLGGETLAGLAQRQEKYILQALARMSCNFLLGAVPAKGAATAGEIDGGRLTAVGKEQHTGPG